MSSVCTLISVQRLPLCSIFSLSIVYHSHTVTVVPTWAMTIGGKTMITHSVQLSTIYLHGSGKYDEAYPPWQYAWLQNRLKIDTKYCYVCFLFLFVKMMSPTALPFVSLK